MAARRPFWKWHRWKSIVFCLWPPSICIWNLKLKFQSKLDLCSGNHVVYRQTDGRTDRRTDKVNPVYPPSNFVGRGYNKTGNNALMWLLLGVTSTDDKSTLVQIMAWCRQATSHYLNQCWPSAKSPYDVTKLQWVNYSICCWGWDIPGYWLGQYHGCWCAGSLSPQSVKSRVNNTSNRRPWVLETGYIFVCSGSWVKVTWLVMHWVHTHLTQIWAADIDIGNIISCNTTIRQNECTL